MTKDFKNISESQDKTPGKKKKQPAKTGANGVPGWIWLLAGLVIGGFISFLVYLKMGLQPTNEAPKAIEHQTAPAKKPVTPRVQTEPEEERFKFYDILPKRTVEVPADNVAPTTQRSLPRKEVEATTATPKAHDYRYLLQAGSFYRYKDADKRKASLALLGVEAKIQAVRTRDNKSLYRVRIGPYKNIKKVNEIEKLLKRNNIKTLLVRTRG